MNRFFNGYKIRYEQLQNLLPMKMSRSKINIFINLDDFFHKLHRPIVEKEFQSTGGSVHRQMVSNIFNLVGHYRNWAFKQGASPSIFLIYTSGKVFKNQTRIHGYRGYYDKITDRSNIKFFTLNSAIDAAIPLIPVIAKYINHVYAIDSHYLEPSILPYYLSQTNPADYNLLVSRDPYDLQYTGLNNWSIILPKGDESIVVYKGNLWDHICFTEKIDDTVYFHPEMYLWAKAILGDRYRSIPKLTRTGWKTVFKYLKTVSRKDESSETLDLQLNKLVEYIDTCKIDNTDVNNNMYCSSVKQQVEAMFESDKAIVDQQIIDMVDYAGLKSLNDTVFREYPLNILMLRDVIPTINSQYTRGG